MAEPAPGKDGETGFEACLAAADRPAAENFIFLLTLPYNYYLLNFIHFG